MKSKKLLACVMAGSMVLSLAACGGEDTTSTPDPTQAPAATAAPTAEPVAKVTPSIDFEDGQSGFVMMSTAKRKADDSNVSVKDFNGSKALYVENVTGGELYIGMDVDALLGDKVTEVKSIQMDVGTEYSDGKFYASSGNLYAYTGAELAENKLDAWSVYLENKNPKTVTFSMGEAAFTAGNDNYIVLVKDDDTGATASSMYVDNIAFLDANGKVIEADTSVVMEAPYEGYRKVVKEEAPAAPGSVTVALDGAYAGDWGAITAIPASEFEAFSGSDVTVTMKFELVSGYDYYLLNPIDFADWASMKDSYTDLAPKAAAEEGDKYHLQDDGFIVIDDWTNNELTFTVSADGVAKILAGGAGLSGQTYGVTVYEAVITGAGGGSTSTTVAMDESYAGDWGATTGIPAAEFAAFSGDVKVTLKYELEGGYDYYLLNPIDLADWASMKESYTDLAPKAAAEEGDLYHLQDDGFIVIDDWTNGEMTFTLNADAVAKIVAGGAGLAGQTYGVTVYEAVLSGSTGAAAESKTVAMDESYAGDWGAVVAIPAAEFDGYSGDVTVTFKFELEGGYDYYLINPIDFADWANMKDYYTDLTPKSAAEEGDLYHLQDDGFIVIDDWTNGELTFTINADGVAKILAGGAGLSGQTYGVTVYEAVISGSTGAAAAPAASTVALDDDYMGDWSATTAIPAAEFEGKSGDVKVTLKFELESGYDYYLLNPIDFADWASMKEYYTDLTPKSAAEEGDLYHLQDDGFIVIDDWTNGEMTFTISADGVAKILAGGAGLAGQTYGVTVYEAVIQ